MRGSSVRLSLQASESELVELRAVLDRMHEDASTVANFLRSRNTPRPQWLDRKLAEIRQKFDQLINA